MKDLAIFGAGGFGRETAWMIQEINQDSDQWNLVGFFDDGLKAGTMVDSLPVLGGMKALNEYHDPIGLVLAVADPATRKALVNKVINKKISFPQLIHPSAYPGSPLNSFGRGVIITRGVILTTGIQVGDFVIINLATTIGHDALIESYSSIMPQCSISGNVGLGQGSFVGSGVRIVQGITLGDNCIIGAGAVVTKSFPANSRLVGVPAKVIKP